jgi:DNA-binding CsgD family transcriptional regulator
MDARATDSATSEEAANSERLARVAAAFENGVVLVDEAGAIVWMDRNARQRLNGGLQTLDLSASKPEGDAVGCTAVPAELGADGKRLTLGIIRVEQSRPAADLVAVIEGVLAESTSWFTRTIVEKLKAVGQPKDEPSPGNGTTQIENLSAREREVLGLICEGQSDAQMAELLSLSENTVRNHVAALYRKIGVKRRTAAVIWARERGITCREDLMPMARKTRSEGRRSGNGHDGGSAPPY